MYGGCCFWRTIMLFPLFSGNMGVLDPLATPNAAFGGRIGGFIMGCCWTWWYCWIGIWFILEVVWMIWGDDTSDTLAYVLEKDDPGLPFVSRDSNELILVLKKD